MRILQLDCWCVLRIGLLGQIAIPASKYDASRCVFLAKRNFASDVCQMKGAGGLSFCLLPDEGSQ